MTTPAGGVPEQGLREIAAKKIAEWRALAARMREDLKRETFESYDRLDMEVRQLEACAEDLEAALERPRPALPDPKIAELVQRLRERCQWKTEMPCERAPWESRCVSCRAADALEMLALRPPQSGPWRVEYNTKLPGSSWWVTDRFGAQPSGSVWSFDSEVQARAVCDALNTVAGSGAETPPQPEIPPNGGAHG